MQDLTKKLIRLVLDTDDSVTEDHRLKILRTLSERPALPPKLLSRKEVAVTLGVHNETVKRYTRSGLLRQINFTARQVRYDQEEVIRFASSGQLNERSPSCQSNTRN